MPMFSDTFLIKALIVIAPGAPTTTRMAAARHVKEQSVDVLEKLLSDAGLTDYRFETSPNNVIPALRDPAINLCIVDFSAIKNNLSTMVTNLKNNNITNQLPILVIAPGLDMETARELYRLGVAYVVREELSAEVINEALWVMDSCLRFVERFKVKAPRLFR